MREILERIVVGVLLWGGLAHVLVAERKHQRDGTGLASFLTGGVMIVISVVSAFALLKGVTP